MNKAILEIDVPDSCYNCNFLNTDVSPYSCNAVFDVRLVTYTCEWGCDEWFSSLNYEHKRAPFCPLKIVDSGSMFQVSGVAHTKC